MGKLIVILVLLAAVVGSGYYLLNNIGVMRARTIDIEHGSVQAVGEEKTAMFAGGCFWCVESDFEKVRGVMKVVSGYSGGTNENPTYDNYSSAGHKEVVLVTYDSATVSYRELAEYLLRHIDPTDATGSFYDRGLEYSSAIYYANEAEKQIAEGVIAETDALDVFDVPIVTEVLPQETFWPAEEYHQDYYIKHPLKYGYYRNASGRDTFIEEHWGSEAHPLTKAKESTMLEIDTSKWENFEKPSKVELQSTLTDIQYKITQKNGTEPAFQNDYWENHADGIYVDIVSGEPLYSSTDKFDSGTGWPSFTKAIYDGAVTEHADYRLILPRTEVRSKYADSHLGHVFNDAPAELGGIRHCINSAALRFVPKENMEAEGYGELLTLFE